MTLNRYHDQRLWLKEIPRELNRNPKFRDLPVKQLEQFGNQLFISPNLSFRENYFQQISGDRRAARLLIATEGQELFGRHKKLLSQLDRALSAINTSQRETDVRTLSNLNLEQLNSSGQAISYRTQIGVDDLKVREIQSVGPKIDGVAQPLYKEMLQVQTATRELKPQLEELGIELPLYYFASGQVALMRFELGDYPAITPEFEEKVIKFKSILDQYIRQKKIQQDPAWSLVKSDVIDPGDQQVRVNNFIQRSSDGAIVCIDPFLAWRESI